MKIDEAKLDASDAARRARECQRIRYDDQQRTCGHELPCPHHPTTRALVFRPGAGPVIEQVGTDLKGWQLAIRTDDGVLRLQPPMVEFVSAPRRVGRQSVAMLCDEDGIARGLPLNRNVRWLAHAVVGPMVFVAFAPNIGPVRHHITGELSDEPVQVDLSDDEVEALKAEVL